MQAIGKAIDDKIDASQYIASLNSGQIDTIEKKKSKKLTAIKDDKGKTSKTKGKDDSNTKVSKTKKINESPRSKTKGNTPKDSSRNKNKSDKTNTSERKEKILTEEEKVSEISKKEVVTEVATPKEITMPNNIFEDRNHPTKKEEVQNNISDDQVKVQDQNNDRQHVQQAENSSNSRKDSVNLDIHKKEDVGNKNFENKEMKNDIQRLTKPKSARIKNYEENTSSIKQTNSVERDKALKPLEISSKHFLFNI